MKVFTRYFKWQADYFKCHWTGWCACIDAQYAAHLPTTNNAGAWRLRPARRICSKMVATHPASVNGFLEAIYCRVRSDPHHPIEMDASETYNQSRWRSACCRHQLIENWITELKPSSDGQVRTVKVIVAGKEMLRPISRLCQLELNDWTFFLVLFNTCWNTFEWFMCMFYVNLVTCWNIFVWLNVTHLMGPVYTPLSPALCAHEMLFVD